MDNAVLTIGAFESTTFAFVVYLLGVQLTRRVALLRDFNIPEPVSGGVLVALATMAIFQLSGIKIGFDLAARDYFLLVFFSGIGLNARIADLMRGGRPLAILLALTIVYVLLQNGVGLVAATLFGQPSEFSVLLGSAALIGGHGTVIAWAPRIAEITGAPWVEELGIAMATLGLVCAALIGGPMARYLIAHNRLTPDQPEAGPTVGVGYDAEASPGITHVTLMRVMLWLHVTIGLGLGLGGAIEALFGLGLPDFVPCLLTGIVLSNLVPLILPRVRQVRRTPTLAVVSDFALGTFLAMSLMSLQLWTLAGSGLLLATTLALQTVLAVLFCIGVLFRLLGRDYTAAVLAAGFGGFAMGATPTAIANMTAVTKRHGPAPMAFVILPLISAFFADLVNSVAIQLFLSI